MAEAARTLVTVADFLAFEGEPDRRYELVGGELVTRAPPTGAHGLLVARLEDPGVELALDELYEGLLPEATAEPG